MKLFVPKFYELVDYITNEEHHVIVETSFWDQRPGINIQRLSASSEPIIVNLTTHLHGKMGLGLLEGLKKSKAKNEAPGEFIVKK